jgi:hypothetical protein
VDAASFGIATGAFREVREDWGASVALALSGGWRFVELTAVTGERLESLVGFLGRERHMLDAFERVSIHAPSRPGTSAANAVASLAKLDGDLDVVVHPDVYAHEPSLGRLGGRAVFENMDVQKRFGSTVADLEEVFATHPRSGFCLDVAHVWTLDPGLRLGGELIERFGDRLRQVHVSGIEPNGTHRETTADDLARYAPLLERCRHVPWLLEERLADPGPGLARAAPKRRQSAH